MTPEEFRANIRGDLIEPEHPAYNQARRVDNGMIDKRPRWILRCMDAADVRFAIQFARENGLVMAIRGGGHSVAGLSTCDNGLVIDLSRMRGIRVDATARTARVEGGATWGDVDHATHACGFATPGGVISTTGVGGLTLGGGLGYLTRKCGLSIDNVLEADIVLADGQVVTASKDKNPDLYWAIRGGGGNFGVVTSFLYRLHPVSTVIAGPTLWPLEQAADVMRFFRDFTLSAPEDINGLFAFLTVPPGAPFPEALHNQKMCGVVWCYAGPSEAADSIFRPIRRFHPPAFELLGPMPYPRLQSIFDDLYPPGLQNYWRGDFFTELTDDAILAHVEHGSQLPTPLSAIHIFAINGAAHRVGKHDTAFSYRDANWAQVIDGVDPDPANNQRMIAWVKDTWEATHPHSAGGAYINFLMSEGEDRIRATYRDNYDRLAAVKAKYDPDNLFRMNQNVRPEPARVA